MRIPVLGRLVIAVLAAVGISVGVMYATGSGPSTDPTSQHSTAPKPPSSGSGSGSGSSGSGSGSGSAGTTTPVTPPAPVITIPKPVPPIIPIIKPPVIKPPVIVPPVVLPPVVTPPVVVPPVVKPPVVTPPSTKPQTVVSLTFDDGDANQMSALPILQSHGMKGTFFIITGYVGASGYVTRANVDSIAAAGNEIGGHTVTHPDLTTLPTAEVQRQVCNSRNTLASWGYTPTSFAYPFAETNTSVEQVVKACGFNSARMLGDIASRFGCAGCGASESIPPSDPYYTKALDQVDSTWTLADMQTAVTNAEKRGGWLQFTFHNICDPACGDPSMTPTLLNQFLTWLQPRAATNNTVVKTVNQVIGGTVKPLVTAPTPPPPVNGVNGVQNAGFESGTSCWFQGGYGTNTPSFAIGGPAHTGTQAGQLTMSAYTDGDAKWLQAFDLGGCSPSVTAGQTYSMRAWYQSTAVTQFEVYLRDSGGAWSYWTSSPWFAASAGWTQAVWTTPAIPAGMTGISFGLNLFSTGTLSTDDYELYNTIGAPAPAPLPAAAVAPLVAEAPAADATTDATTDATDPSTTTGTDPTGATGTTDGAATGGSGSSGSGTDPSGTPSAPPTPPAVSSTPPSTPADPPAPADPPSTPAAPAVAPAPAATDAAGSSAPTATEPAPNP